MKGKLIIIEGSDGSGKTTQTKLLEEYLKSRSVAVQTFKFPQHNTFYGRLVDRFLNGELGELQDVSPYVAALLFALDRGSVKEAISTSLNRGFVVSDRYTPSNIAQHAAKIEAVAEKQKFKEWVEELEYRQLQIPKEDLVI